MKLTALPLLLVFLTSAPNAKALAADLVSADADIEKPIEEVASEPAVPTFETTVTTDALRSSYRKVFNKKEIQESGATSITELLEEKGNVTVFNSAFRDEELYIRGGDASHVLVLVDGFPIYDAVSSKRTFKLNSINLASVVKIEVIKGSQVARYGGQALSAVIKVETISAQPNPNSTKLKGAIGDPDFRQSFVGKNRELYIDKSISNSNNETIRIGAFAKSDLKSSPIRYSKFTYPEQSGAGEGSWIKSYEGVGRLSFRVRSFGEKKKLINRTQDAIDFDFTNSHWMTGIQFAPMPDLKLPTVSLSYLASDRSYYHPVNALNMFEFDQQFSGEVLNFRIEQPLLKNAEDQLSVGASFADERGTIVNTKGQNPAVDGSRGDFDQQFYGAFMRGSMGLANVIVDTGLRWERLPTESDSIISENISAQVGASYDNWRVEYSKGVRAPTLHNLYDFIYGNPDLNTEKVQTVTAEWTFEREKKWKSSIAGFYSIYRDLIEARRSGALLQNINIAEAEITGVEADLAVEFGPKVTLDINTIYQNPMDKVEDKRIKYRPYHTHSAQLYWRWTPALSQYISYYYSGDRIDFGSTSSVDVVLPSYNLYGLGVKLQASESFLANFKVQNIFDKRYSESYSFYSEGMRATFGIEYSN